MNKAKLKEYLLDLDTQFAKESQTSGIDAWNHFLAIDAIMVTSGHGAYIVGKENILNALKGLYNLQNLCFVWEPKLCDVSEDLSMGFTTGIYTRTYTNKQIKHKEIGKYTTIWKKYNDNWYIALDIGNEEGIQ